MTARRVSIGAIAVILLAGLASVFALLGAVEGGLLVDSGGPEAVTVETTQPNPTTTVAPTHAPDAPSAARPVSDAPPSPSVPAPVDAPTVTTVPAAPTTSTTAADEPEATTTTVPATTSTTYCLGSEPVDGVCPDQP